MKAKARVRVLFLGQNHSSVMNSYVYGLRKLGVECSAISFDITPNAYANYDNIYMVYRNGYNHFTTIRAFFKLLIVVFKSNKIHIISNFSVSNRFSKVFHWAVFGAMNKRYFVTFTGSDIRDALDELRRNPFFLYAYDNPGYEGKNYETKDNADRLQSYYAQKKAHPVLTPETIPLINKDIFKIYSTVHHPSFNLHKPPERKVDSDVIRIVHAPSSPIAKGTQFIVRAVEKIIASGTFNIEFRLLQGLSNTEYQEELSKCHILIDQLIWGWYGIASQQALEMGKVVVAYLSEDRLNFVKDCPIVNANIENIYEKLNALISNKSLIETISKDSMKYYDKYHKPEAVARQLLEVYEN